MSEGTEQKCGYTWPEDHKVEDSPNHQSCCWRDTYQDSDRCVWHASPNKVGKKPVEALQKSLVDNEVREQTHLGGELLDGVVLTGIELGDSISLDGYYLRDSSLCHVGLTNANLQNAKFSNADLSNADLSNADLRSAGLGSADLTDADLSFTDLQDADLESADFTNATAWSADLTHSYLFEANLEGADFSGASLADSFLEGANLTNANLSGVDLSESFLMDATLIDAKFGKADLSNANLAKSELQNTYFRNANLTNTYLTDTFLRGVNLRDTDLTDVDLTDAYLWDTDLTNAALTKVDVSGTNLIHVDFQGANITKCNLEDSTLWWASFVDSTVIRTNFSDADLLGADLEGASLKDSQFDGANLIAARLYNMKPQGVSINDQTTFGEQNVYEREADPCDEWHPLNGEPITPTSLPDKFALAVRSGQLLQSRLHSIDTSSPTASISKVEQAIKRFQRHHSLDTEAQRKVGEQLKKATSVYRTRQRLHRENSRPRNVAKPYVREQHSRRKRAFATESYWEWFKHATYRWVMLYGESPARVVGTSIVVVAVFAAIYSVVGGIVIGGEKPDLIGNIYFSAVTFSTLGYGGIEPTTTTTQLLASVQSLIGGILIALLVAVFGRRALR